MVCGLMFKGQEPDLRGQAGAMAAATIGTIARGLGVGAHVPRLGSGYWGRGPGGRAGRG